MTRLELTRLREKYGYSLRTVAKEAGISHPYLQQLENGNKKLTLELREQILTAMYRLQEQEAGKR